LRQFLQRHAYIKSLQFMAFNGQAFSRLPDPRLIFGGL
jgi:hypothetical protein